MPLLYEPFQSNLKNKNEKKLFYPRVVRAGNISIVQLAREIAAYSSLTTGDVKNTIDNLVTVMSQHLQNSESVTLDGLGSFRMVMKSNGKGVETANEVSAAQASITIRFQPSFTRNANHSMATRAMVTGVKCMRYDKLTGSSTGEKPQEKPDGGEEEAPDPEL